MRVGEVRSRKWIWLLVGTVIAPGKADYRDDDVVQPSQAGKKVDFQYTQNQPLLLEALKSDPSTQAEESILT